MDNNGFIIVASDDIANPILGYSLTNGIICNELPANLEGWLQHYSEEIKSARNAGYQGCDETETKWFNLINNIDSESTEREMLELNKYDGEHSELLIFSGTTDSESGNLPVDLTWYDDGSYEVTANDFTERGIMTLNSKEGVFKTYPDHPTEGIRGLNQVATVPLGSVSKNEWKIKLEEFRVRTSDNLSRVKCNLIQK